MDHPFPIRSFVARLHVPGVGVFIGLAVVGNGFRIEYGGVPDNRPLAYGTKRSKTTPVPFCHASELIRMISLFLTSLPRSAAK